MSALRIKHFHNILVIDDDIEIIKLLTKVLENSGYTVYYATNYEDGLEIFHKTKPHLVITDYKLNDHSGFELIKKIRSGKHFDIIPLVLMSNSNHKKALVKSIELGANDYIEKPIQTKVLLQKIKKLLKLGELPTIVINEDQNLKCTILGDTVQINELGVLLTSSVKLAPNTEVDIKSEFLKKLGTDHCRLITHNQAKNISAGSYKFEVIFQGLEERVAKKIRQHRS